MQFNNLINNILKEEDEAPTREDRMKALHNLSNSYVMSSQEERNRVLDLVRGICDIDVVDRMSILHNSDPEVSEVEGDRHNGKCTVKLTLPLRNIDAESIKSIVQKRQGQRWPGYEDIDVYEDVLDPEVLEIEPIDYYSRAVNFERGTHLIEFEDLGNGTGRFTIEQSWHSDY